MIIDFTALTERSEPWPKSNDFGQPTTVKKTGVNAWTPKSPYKKALSYGDLDSEQRGRWKRLIEAWNGRANDGENDIPHSQTIRG
jgi:hypothetical protein